MRYLEKKSVKMTAIVLALVLFFNLFNLSNSIEASAATGYKYLIKVNKVMNCITVYEKDKNGKYTVPVKAFVCSTGAATPLGTFRTPVKYRWKVLLDDVWGQYSTRITGSILFHSVWYYHPDPSTLSAVQYNKLGTMCSHGCIRLTVEDAKWIYDNCPIGTTVTIYNDTKSAGPLGKPQAIKLQAGTGWDPTDTTNPKNPFNNKKPVIVGAANKTVKYGSKVDLKQGVTARSTTGFSITSDIKVSGKVDTKVPGKYKVTYSVTDLLDRTAKTSVYYTVPGDTSAPKLAGVKDQLVGGDKKIDRAFALKGVSATFSGKKLPADDIKVKIEDNKDDTYTIIYTVKASNGKTATKTATITVDKEAPEILGISDKDIAWDTVVDEKFALDGVSAFDVYDDKISTRKINVEIVKNEDNTYTVTYTIKDHVGNEAKETVTYTITDFLKLEGVKDQTIAKETVVDMTLAMTGVTAFDNETDITSNVEVTISELTENYYTVTYKIADENGNERTATARFTVEENTP